MLPLSDDKETALGLTGKLSVLFIVIFLLLVVFADPIWMEEKIQEELNDIVNVIGDETGRDVINRANIWYIAAFKNTGIEKGVNRMIGYDNNSETNEGIKNAGEWLSIGINKSLKTFWLMMYQSTVRLSVLTYWGIFLCAIIVASAVDGYNRRRIKKHDFGWASVNYFRMAAKALVFCPFIVTTYLSLPIIPAYIQFVPVLILIIVAVAVNLLVSNMQKMF